MSTAVALVQDTPRSVAAQPLPDMTFGQMMEMGDALVRTGFLPAHLRNGAQVAAVILTGRELGMTPMRAIRSLNLVKGKVCENADSQLSRFKADGGRASFTTLNESEAVLVLTHPNGDKHTESFTMADAKAAGLASNDNYRKFPKAMLRSRVITAGLKSLGWEGGAGVYDPAELMDVSPEPEPQVEAEPDVPMPTDKQTELLAKLLKSHVWSDDERTKITRKASKSREHMTAALDYVIEETHSRKAKEKAEKATPEVEVTEVSDDEFKAQRARVAQLQAPADPYEEDAA